MRRATATDIAFVIEKRSDRALASISSKGVPEWAKEIGGQVRVLLAMLRDVMAGNFRAPWQTMAAVTAMMQYIMNPRDLLPDTVPELGYLDDALVVALCLAVSRKDLKRYVNTGKPDQGGTALS